MSIIHELFYEDTLDALYAEAIERFMRLCGLNNKNNKHNACMVDACFEQELLEEAKTAFRLWAVDASVTVLAQIYSGIDFRGDALIISGQAFSCNQFTNIDKNSIKHCVFYLIAIKSSFKAPNFKAEFYQNLWGNAYLSAALGWLKACIHNIYFVYQGTETYQLLNITGVNPKKIRVSTDPINPDAASKRVHSTDVFGPGYYGTDLDDMNKISKILNFSKAGVELNESGIMNPPMSIAGFYILTEDKDRLQPSCCLSCVGSRRSCRYCNKEIE